MTTTTENVRLWSVTTGTANAAVDAGIASSDAQSPDTVDNNIRSIMTAKKRESDDQGGWIVATGTATALIAVTASGITTAMLTNGLRLCVRTASASTGAATIAVDAAAITDIKKQGGAAITTGDWASGDLLDLVYSSTASAFIAINIAMRAAFSAHKGGVNQTIASAAATQLTFGAEAFDVGAHFASDAWTPPAGTVLITAIVSFTDITVGQTVLVWVYKDGAAYQLSGRTSQSLTTELVTLSIIDQANGANVYTLLAQSSDGSYTIDGTATATRFMGTMI